MSESSENRPVAGLSTNRLEAFSDGVFAVAITLLVLNLQVPQIAVVSELVPKLGALWPKLLSYALSFVIVGIYWVAHHNTFHYIKRSDRNLLWLNILLMMRIVFIPFPTALLGQYPEQQVSVIIYAGTLVITGLVLQLQDNSQTRCPTIDRIGLHARAVICKRYKHMWLECNLIKVASNLLSIDIDRPTRC
jgi:uncharacterized membrane protein